MSKKLFIHVISMILFPILLVLFTINIIQIFRLHTYTFTYNYKLLYIDGNNDIVDMLIKVIALVEFYLVLSFFFSEKKDKQQKQKAAKINQTEYSYLQKKSQAKKGLVRVEFTKNLDVTTSTLRYRLDYLFNGIKKFYNRILQFLKVSHEKHLNTLQFFTPDHVPYRAGIPIVTSKNAVWVDAGKNHSIIVGTTNSGKSFSIIYIALILCVLAKENILVNDIKGELYDMLYPILVKHGYKTICINFIDPKAGSYYNPLSLAIRYYRDEYLQYKLSLLKEKDKIITLLDLLSKQIDEGIDSIDKMIFILNDLPTMNFSSSSEAIVDVTNKICMESKNANDGFWNDAAGDVLIGLITLMLEEYSIVDGQKVFLNDDLINFKSIQMLINDMKAPSDNKPSPLLQYIQKNRKVTSQSYLKLKTYLESPKNTIGSILAVINRVTQKLLTNDDVISMMSKNDIDFTKLDDELTAIFIIIHDEKSTYHNLVSIIIQQVYEVLIKLARKNPKNELKIPMNVQWDEFANGAPWKTITNALPASRSRGIRFNLVVQDFGQIESLYGKDAVTIKANVMNIIFLLTSDNSTKEEISKMADTTSYFDKQQGKVIEKRLISTARLSKLQLGEAVIIRQRKNPYIGRYTSFNDYNFFSTYTKIKQNKSYKKPYRNQMDKTIFIDITTGETNANRVYQTRNQKHI